MSCRQTGQEPELSDTLPGPSGCDLVHSVHTLTDEQPVEASKDIHSTADRPLRPASRRNAVDGMGQKLANTLSRMVHCTGELIESASPALATGFIGSESSAN